MRNNSSGSGMSTKTLAATLKLRLCCPALLLPRPALVHFFSLLQLQHPSLLHHQLISSLLSPLGKQNNSDKDSQHLLPPHTSIPEHPHLSCLPSSCGDELAPPDSSTSLQKLTPLSWLQQFPLLTGLFPPTSSNFSHRPLTMSLFCFSQQSSSREWSISIASTSSPPSLSQIHSSQGESLPLPSVKDTNALRSLKINGMFSSVTPTSSTDTADYPLLFETSYVTWLLGCYTPLSPSLSLVLFLSYFGQIFIFFIF